MIVELLVQPGCHRSREERRHSGSCARLFRVDSWTVSTRTWAGSTTYLLRPVPAVPQADYRLGSSRGLAAWRTTSFPRDPVL